MAMVDGRAIRRREGSKLEIASIEHLLLLLCTLPSILHLFKNLDSQIVIQDFNL